MNYNKKKYSLFSTINAKSYYKMRKKFKNHLKQTKKYKVKNRLIKLKKKNKKNSFHPKKIIKKQMMKNFRINK